MQDQLWDLEVSDRQTFIQFLKLLHQDFLENPDGWENNNLDSFLEALCAYAADIQHAYDNNNLQVDADQPRWQTFSDILRGAVIYE